MGLDLTHGCWHGAYSAFARWRDKIAEVAGIADLMTMQGYGGETPWDDADPLTALLNHSDCDGNLEVAVLTPLAARLEELLPRLPDGDGGGHIGNWRAKTTVFIAGLRRAAELGENVEFH